MKIVYIGSNEQLNLLKSSEKDFIALSPDTWDDYGNKMTLSVDCFINGKQIDTPRIKVFFEEKNPTFLYLDEKLKEGWNGHFPVLNENYISVPIGIEFYQMILGHTNLETTSKVAEALHDASYLTHITEDDKALAMTNSSVFRNSLQREGGSIKAFQDGWKIFKNIAPTIEDFSFYFKNIKNEQSELFFKFKPTILPADINVLIGPNGSGKSQSLQRIVKAWLNSSTEYEPDEGFSKNPHISQLVVVSYSPFEVFPVDLEHFEKKLDQNTYKYFGLRKRQWDADQKSSRISVDTDHPRNYATCSLLNCVIDDEKFGAIKNWSNKIHTAQLVLRQAIDFDFLALELPERCQESQIVKQDQYVPLTMTINSKNFVPISGDTTQELHVSNLGKHALKNGIHFIKNNQVVQLSSGQRLFSYIVINILGAIKRNSLIIVDEPELFLHPTLEVAFIQMLKTILEKFSSKAILATHSLVTAREIPRECVHVIKMTEQNIFIDHPPFETFGGDMQKISSYVFGDKSVSKPYEQWLKKKIEEYGNAENLIKTLGVDINEEMIIQIHAMERHQWS